MAEMNYETCFSCGARTGKAGRGDGSLYDAIGNGPYCEDCWNTVKAEFEADIAAELELAKAGRVQAENERLRAENERDGLAAEVSRLKAMPAAGAMPWQLHIAAILMNYCGDDVEAALAKAAQLNDAYAAQAGGAK